MKPFCYICGSVRLPRTDEEIQARAAARADAISHIEEEFAQGLIDSIRRIDRLSETETWWLTRCPACDGPVAGSIGRSPLQPIVDAIADDPTASAFVRSIFGAGRSSGETVVPVLPVPVVEMNVKAGSVKARSGDAAPWCCDICGGTPRVRAGALMICRTCLLPVNARFRVKPPSHDVVLRSFERHAYTWSKFVDLMLDSVEPSHLPRLTNQRLDLVAWNLIVNDRHIHNEWRDVS